MQRGGDVLYLIGLLAFVMWFLIFERMWYFFFSHRNHLGKSVQEWDSRQDKSSWNSKAIRDMLIAQNEIRIDQNLGLIKMCVGIAPLFGLFGTITGMIEVFHLLAVTGGRMRRLWQEEVKVYHTSNGRTCSCSYGNISQSIFN